MGYSLDESSSTSIVKGASLSGSVTAATGNHVLHVKSWGAGGASCTTDVNLVVEKASSSSTTNVTVSAPLDGATVPTPFALSATGTLCSGQAITAMGFSLDNSTSTTSVSGTSISTSVASAAGTHTLHVKSWGKGGKSCSKNLAITVSGPSIPATATVATSIQNLTTWSHMHDSNTKGASSGVMSLVASPSQSGSARKFATRYTTYGGERYNVNLTPDPLSTKFVYDTQVYIASPSADISNLEFDVNQVMNNGDTVIFGFQCDRWSHTWDYTANTGTPANPVDRWLHSTQDCSPQNWSTNTWHHLQIQYSRDASGNVTYKAVWLDGVEQDLNITVLSAFSLGWTPTLNSNFQVGGFNSTSGSSTIYLDNLTLYSW